MMTLGGRHLFQRQLARLEPLKEPIPYTWRSPPRVHDFFLKVESPWELYLGGFIGFSELWNYLLMKYNYSLKIYILELVTNKSQ